MAVEAPTEGWGGFAGRARDGLRSFGEVPAAVRARELVARRHAPIAITLYLLGALVMQRHAVAHIATVISGNLVGDPVQYMWSDWWWPHALLHGINPFVTHDIWYPVSYNLGSVTSTPVPSLLFAPLTLILGPIQGPVVDYNLCNLLAPMISGWFAYRLCLYLTKAPGASILGGWLYGFSAYGLSQLQGHMNLVFTFLPVVLLLLSLQRMDEVLSRRRFVVLTAVTIAIQIGIGTEIVFTTTCMLVATVIAAVVLAPAATRRRIVALLPELFAGYALAAIVCAPFLYYALTGPEIEANYNSILKIADALSFVIPTPLFRIGAHRFLPISSGFPSVSGYAETGSYLGLPLIIGAVAYVVAEWRRWGVKVLVIISFVATVWALGPSLTIDGHGTITLPWKLLDLKHPFNEVTPVRIALYTELAASIAFALWLAAPKRFPVWRWLTALLAVAFLFPDVNGKLPTGQTIYSENIQSPAFIADGLYRRYMPRNTVILPIPFGPFGNSLLWQAQAQGYFREASGWFGFWPPGYSNSMLVGQLAGFHAFTDPVGLMAGFLSGHHVGAVVIVDGQGGPWPQVLGQLGLQPIATGGVMLYRVPATLSGR